ncbi:MAG TPA: hypothetical protein VK672_01770 [Solirubrobacteraceae bacterium]|jgi:hypothetical protein|nr:hypothetical protein [Solirubrobacteraceae bacterium]
MEAIRAQMLLRVNPRREILAHRDAMVVSLQYGLGARNQEVWGLRCASLTRGHPAREFDFIIPGDLSGPGHGRTHKPWRASAALA